ncbi:MAG: thioredoxin family protein [Deltaproteobacteria bacterium]|nr:thioredoxin family protein [Deltaproteobacteria bacterium]MBP1717139.1 thioredoxin family protein [Deltaproteobacteria bacterium]
MRGRCKRLGRIFVALTCAGALWSAGGDFSWVPKASGQNVFQSYTKPQTIPDFSVQNLQGNQVDIRSHRGQVILLNFWATWCPNCRQEGPSLQKLYNQYQSRGLILYRIASKEKPETIKNFLEKESLNMPALIDKTGQTERLFGVWVHPTTYLINRQSLVVYRTMGAMDWTTLQTTSIIDQLLKER